MTATQIRVIRTYKGDINRACKDHYRWKDIPLCERWLNSNPGSVILISGRNDGGGQDLFIPDYARPFIIYRERNRNRFLWMRLDLENPQEPKGGDLTAAQAITAVTKVIADLGRHTSPVANPTLLRKNGTTTA